MGKSFIFCTSYIQEQAPNGKTDRWKRWQDYYNQRLPWFGAERLFLIDDGTPLGLLEGFQCFSADPPEPESSGHTDQFPGPERFSSGAVMFRFLEHLGRCTKKCFPGWWRSFAFSVKVAKKYGYTKIIHLESDAFVLTPRLADHILSLQSGWSALWCPSWNFPESAIQVICQDCFPELEKLSKREDHCRAPWHVKGFAERTLPFTQVVKNTYKGDRYSGYRSNYPRDADYVCQSLPEWDFGAYLTPDQLQKENR